MIHYISIFILVLLFTLAIIVVPSIKKDELGRKIKRYILSKQYIKTKDFNINVDRIGRYSISIVLYIDRNHYIEQFKDLTQIEDEYFQLGFYDEFNKSLHITILTK